jgi:hypothetical protein
LLGDREKGSGAAQIVGMIEACRTSAGTAIESQFVLKPQTVVKRTLSRADHDVNAKCWSQLVPKCGDGTVNDTSSLSWCDFYFYFIYLFICDCH